MFIAIQKKPTKHPDSREDEIIVTLSNTKEEIENDKTLYYDRIEEVEYAEMYNGTVYTDKEQLELAKKEKVRKKRNNMLNLSDEWGVSDRPQTEEVEKHKKWREYLRNYTNQGNWWLNEPLDYSEWIKNVDNQANNSYTESLTL